LTHNLARRRALRAFAKRLGIKAGSKATIELLDSALTHDSYANERRSADGVVSNERLEFLGDAVLGHVVAHDLFSRHPRESEGALSRRRAALVSRSSLASAARTIAMAPLLLLGKGEAAARGEERPSILAAAFEALVGAVYLNEGFDAAERFVRRHLSSHAAGVDESDPKTVLQEYAQGRFKLPPAYAVTHESGPAHAKTFTVAVSVGGDVMGIGSGPTKKRAQAEAAAQALRKIPAKARPMRGTDPST
jgi:ribonuclease III